MPGIRQDKVERIVVDMMRRELMRLESVERFRAAFLRKWKDLMRERRVDQDIIRAELATIERDIHNYVAAIERGLRYLPQA